MLKETYEQPISGRIRLYERDSAGTETLLRDKSNVITYTAADILAKLLAGDADSFPRHIGFIYGEADEPGAAMADPDSLSLETRRVHDWDTLKNDVAAASANMLICPLVLNPTVSLDPDSNPEHYVANSVTFTAHTGAFTEYAFTPGLGDFASTLDMLPNIYFYHAVLLNRKQVGNTITYTPFARVILGTAPFTAKAANRELAVYWTIVFK